MGRLESQCRRILELLRERGNEGVTNYELAGIALKYTSRISDLRDAGYRILATCEDSIRGVYRYHLLTTTPRKSRLFDE